MMWRYGWILGLWVALALPVTSRAEDPPAGEAPDAATAVAEKLKEADLKPGYRVVPPEPGPATGLPPSTTEATVAEQAKQPQLTAETTLTWDAFTTAHPDLGGQSPQQVFAAFQAVMDAAVASGQGGETLLQAIYEGEWSEKLIRATNITQDAAGDNSPKTIKTLIKEGAVNKTQAALMWFARDAQVKRALKPILAKLHADYPHLTFRLTILDSGSYGSLGSDIDKTTHLTATDADGKAVKTFGEGGQVMQGDVGAFTKMVYAEFDKVGMSMSAKHSIAKSLDTEFFPSDTLTPGIGRGSTHSTFHGSFEHTVAKLNEQFAALQRNAGPSYQFAATVVAQVLGRTVEQDVAIQDKRAQLAEQRANYDQLSADAKFQLVLDEALVAAHSPATVVSLDEDGNVKMAGVDVVEFLEQEGLAVNYDANRAAENAVGNHEKYIHKSAKVWSDEMTFIRKQYEAYQFDFAKYGDRGIKDLAKALIPDNDPNRSAGFGLFNRSFGAEGSGVGRPYTRAVHDQIFRIALDAQYDQLGLTGEERNTRMAKDLDLYWAVCKANERMLALKADPASAKTMGSALDFPHDTVFAELIAIIDRDHPQKLGADFADLSAADQLQRRVTAAMELHVVEAERSLIVLTAGHLDKALSVWLTTASRKEAARIRILDRKRRRQMQAALNQLKLATPPRDPVAARAHAQEIERLATQIRDLDADIERRTRNPRAAEGELAASGYHTAKRLYQLYYHNDRAMWERMTATLSAEKQADMRLMVDVWEARATPSQVAEFHRKVGVDPAALPRLDGKMLNQIAMTIADSLGFDTDAYFSPPRGQTDNPNSPANVLKSYFKQTYLSVGGINSLMGIARQMQLAGDQSFEQRMTILGDAVVNDLVGGVPVGGKVYTTYLAMRSGDATQTAGGVVDLAADLMQMYLQVAAGPLDEQMVRAGLIRRLAMLDTAGALGGHAAMFLTMARTVVELYGHEAFAPIKDHFFQLVFKGYIDVQPAGNFFRVGSNEVDSRIPVTPIIEPAGSTVAFLYLKPESAKAVFDDLHAAGQTDAANAMLHLLGYDENVDGTVDKAVMIDLQTDFTALANHVGDETLVDQPTPELRRELEVVKTRVQAFYAGQTALQTAIKARIRADRELRRGSADHLNLWVLASRENLGLSLDAQFQRETQLLYQSLWGMDEARETLAADSTRAWEMWQANASSQESADKIRQQFLAIYSPRQILEAKQAALKQQGEALSGIPWGQPSTMLSEYLTRQALAWAGMKRPEDVERLKKQAAIEHQAAGIAAFRNNSYANTRTPTQPYRLEDANAWFATEIQQWQGFLKDLPERDLRPGQDRADLAKQAGARLAAMKSEVGVVTTGFQLAEEAVAPKVAQQLIMSWLAGEAPYENDVHLGVKFVWHDAETQARVRDQLVKDLVRGRQLIHAHRAQASSFETLYQAEAMALLKARYIESYAASLKAVADGAGVLESRAELRATTPEMPGEMTLTATPYLVKTRDGKLEVAADIRVDHDNLRAESAETKLDYRIVPFDKLDLLPAPALERALTLSEIKREDVLCVVEVAIAVISAKPVAGHEDSAYTTLPKQTWYMVVPGTPPEETEDTRKDQLVFPVKPDATGTLNAANAHTMVDMTVDTVYAGEQLWLWFNTPADANYVDFHLQIKNAAGDVVQTGLNQHILGTPGDLDSVDGAPARYAIALWSNKINKAGAYTVEIRPTQMAVGGGGGEGENTRPWVKTATFELADLTLAYQGITAETVRNSPFKKVSIQGSFSLDAEGSPETPVRLTMTTRWRHLKNNEPDGPEERSIGIFTLSMPKELNLTSETRRAGLQYALVAQSVGKIRGTATPVNAKVHGGFLIHGAPNRKMIAEIGRPTAWTAIQNPTVLADYQASGATDVVSYKGDTGSRIRELDGDARQSYYGLVFGPEGHGTTRLTWGAATDASGEPHLPIAWHFRSGKAHLYIPISLEVPGAGIVYAYAVYGFQAGAYDGPGAEGGPDGGNGEDDGSLADGNGDDGNGANGEDGDGDATAGGIGPNGDIPRDPNAIDPNHPDVARLIQEWLRIAEPPPNATIGAQLRFTPYGVWEGRTPTGTISVNAPPDAAAGMTPEAYCWLNREKIDSVDHCTIGEWVMARLNGDTTNCVGRYKPLPRDTDVRVGDFRGQQYGAARAAAMSAGLKVKPVAGDPAATADGAGKVLSQTPAAATVAKAGDEVTLVVAGPHVPAITVPQVAGMTRDDAQRAIEAAGLRVVMVTGEPAPTARLSERVQSQVPAAGSETQRDTTVRVTLHSRHVPQIAVPDLARLPEARAKAAVEQAGLTFARRDGGEAPDAASAGAVERQEPAAGQQVERGTKVTATIYGRYTPPITVPDLAGMTANQAADALRAAGLEGRRRAGPEAPDAGAAGKVQVQTPAAGTRVERGTIVTATVYGAYTPPLTVPNLVGMAVTEASDALIAAGLPGERVDGPAAPDAASAGKVQRQEPAAGTRVERNTKVMVTVYGDYRPPLTVPNLVGLTLQEASDALIAAELPGERVDGPAAPDARSAGRVQRQEPAAGTRVERNTKVMVTVYGDYRAPGVVVPNLVGMTENQAADALRGVGLIGQKRVGPAAPNAAAAGTVQAQAPAAGTRVEPGSNVTATVYAPHVPVAEGFALPNLVASQHGPAENILKNMGLVPMMIPDKPARNAADVGRVERTMPAAGTRVKRGDRVMVFYWKEVAEAAEPQPQPRPDPPAAAGGGDGRDYYVVFACCLPWDSRRGARPPADMPRIEDEAAARRWGRAATYMPSDMKLFVRVRGAAARTYSRQTFFKTGAELVLPFNANVKYANGTTQRIVGPFLVKIIGTASTRAEMERLMDATPEELASIDKYPVDFTQADGTCDISIEETQATLGPFRQGWQPQDKEDFFMVVFKIGQAIAEAVAEGAAGTVPGAR